MSSIGLYHMDLWHSSLAVPNLELIKVYAYFKNKGDQVVMIKPQDELDRFNFVYFFKDNTRPAGKEASEKLSISNKKLIGYGFFGMVEKLKPEVFNQPLDYSCYDTVSYKLSVKNEYGNIIKNSLVRIETEDFTDYKKDKSRIYLADNNLANVPRATDFLQEYKQHRFTPLFTVRLNKNNVEDFMQYKNLFTDEFVADDFDADMFKEYYLDRRLVFSLAARENETEFHYMKRLMVMGLIYKNAKLTPSQRFLTSKNNAAAPIIQWVLKNTQTPFIDYYADNKDIQTKILNAPAELRSLYKTNPLKITPSTFDLRKYL